jgi:hypothetical protein
VEENGKTYVSLQIKEDDRCYEMAKLGVIGAFLIAAGVIAYFALPSLIKKCLKESE